jgi:ribosomal protein RSM22 (predicted rRNA methylase)
LLDVGAGPGTASFAAAAAWPDIAGITMIEATRVFAGIAGDLAAASPHPALAGSSRILADATRFGRDLPRADLVVAAYAMAEIAPAEMTALIAALWRATDGALVLIEPGTPAGFARIRAARAALIEAGAGIAAPCPHTRDCPIVTPDWCHFAVRLSRSREHRLAKGADSPFEDEKFSYVVAVRPSVAVVPYAARILAPPHAGKAEMRLKLCTADGAIAERTVPRRERAEYARLRRLWWGGVVT